MVKIYGEYSPYIIMALLIIMGISFLQGVDAGLEEQERNDRLTHYCEGKGAIESLCSN